MPKKTEYEHYCVVARSLELLGERWTLLLVRDLLRGPQRFSDLQRFMGNITPKWLTQRLRDLEAAGIVERDSQPGRREVWYRLTAKGRDLAPVLQAMTAWGVQHMARPPLPDERVFPEHIMTAIVGLMNDRKNFPAMPAAWRFVFEDRAIVTVFDGQRWRVGEESDAARPQLEVRVSARDWAAFLTETREERARLRGRVAVSGDPAHEAEFRRIFRIPAPSASAVR